MPKRNLSAVALTLVIVAAARLDGLDLSTRTACAPDGRIAVIVELSDPPAALYEGGKAGLAATALRAAGAARIDAESQAVALYRAHLESKQEEFLEAAQKAAPSLSAFYRYQTVLNGVAVLVAPEDLDAVSRLPGIARISAIHKYLPELDTSNPLMKAPAFWSALGGDNRAGAGVKIGIIDSGIDFSNPMFADSTLVAPPGFPKGDLSLTNSKVIVARYFQTAEDAANPNMNPGHKTAQDLLGHGSHVAGECAGAKVSLSGPGRVPVTIEGVAPKAWIGDYRVFAPQLFDDNMIAAIESAVNDGMDVINMSIGRFEDSYFDRALDPEARATENAIAAGVVVVVSAGNNGPGAGTVHTPGLTESAITVGASSNAHSGNTVVGVLEVTSGKPSVPSNLARILGAACSKPCTLPSTPLSAPIADAALAGGGTDGLACTAFPNGSLTGQIALVARGICNFTAKGQNVKAGGAVGIIIYNNEEGIRGLPGDPVSVPGILIPRADGLSLKAFVDFNAGNPPTAIGQISAAPPGTLPLVVPVTPEVLADFSSRGPTGTDLRIKPDLTSVGVGCYAPVQDDSPLGENRFPAPDPNLGASGDYDASGFNFLEGTSMSSPRVAGAAALVKQLHPTWTPELVKAALAETASRPTDSGKLGSLGVMQRGSGNVDLSAASAVSSVVLPIHTSFGRIVVGQAPVTVDRYFRLKNLSAAASTYSITVASSAGDPSVVPSVSVSNVTLAAGGETQFLLILTIGNGVAAGEVDSEGFLSVSDGNTTIPGSLHVPYWVRTASQAGTAPVLLSLSVVPSDGNPSNVSVYFTGYDPDSDVTSFRLAIFDVSDNLIVDWSSSLAFSQGSPLFTGTGGFLNANLTLFAGYLPSILRLQLFDSKGNASNVLSDAFRVPVDPIAVTPSSIDFGAVALGSSKDLSVTIRNTGASPVRLYGLSCASSQFRALSPAAPLDLAAGAQQSVLLRFSPLATGTQLGSLTLTRDPPGRTKLTVPLRGSGTGQFPATAEISIDDGTVETGYVNAGTIIVNRLTPAFYPATLQTIRVFFARFTGLPSPVGGQIRLLVFADPSGSGNPPANPQLLVNQNVAIPSTGTVDFPISGGPSISSGDFYVGYQAPTPAAGVGFAADSSGAQQFRGFFSTDNGANYHGPLALTDSAGKDTQINVMIRAVVSVPSSPCKYAIFPASQSLVDSRAASGRVDITTAAGCPSTLTSDVSWITIPSGATGSGSRTVKYNVAANSGNFPRNGTLRIAGLTFPVTQSGPCTPDSATLCLNNGRFVVRVMFQTTTIPAGAGQAIPITGDTGYFWFFSPNNIELVVKVVDGRAFNNKFWVFYGALSDVEYTITVTDTVTGIVKTYFNSGGHLASVSDTAAFAGSAGSPDPQQAAEAGETGAAMPRIFAAPVGTKSDSSEAACSVNATTLCVNAARFKVQVVWHALSLGTSGSGQAVALTGDTGYFWFFSSNNIELVIKVVDGRAFNNKFWVFYGALSNVEYTITVTDTLTGAVKTYFNPNGQLGSVADTAAF